MAPDVYFFDCDNTLYAYDFRRRLPALARAYTRALSKFGVLPENAILIDDALANVEGARRAGMHAFHFTEIQCAFDIEGLNVALDAFAHRQRTVS